MIKPLGWTLCAAFALATAMTIAHPHRGTGDDADDEVRTMQSIRIMGHEIGFEFFVRNATSPSPTAESKPSRDSIDACSTEGATPVVIVLPGGTLQYRP